MDPTATYLALRDATLAGDHASAREHAENLRNWLVRGGFYPPEHNRMEVVAWMDNALRKKETSEPLTS